MLFKSNINSYICSSVIFYIVIYRRYNKLSLIIYQSAFLTTAGVIIRENGVLYPNYGSLFYKRICRSRLTLYEMTFCSATGSVSASRLR